MNKDWFTRVGWYQIGNFRVVLDKKPIWLHRKMMALCLGWIWVDEK